MKIFISWSGDLSHNVAMVLREWIPCVLQTVEPYVSSEDIDKGTRWSSDIANELETSSFGIICVTQENLNAPWIHFEAGALSKIVKKSYVCPVLFGVKKSEVKGPLLQFQSASYEKEDIKKLIYTINSVCESESLESKRLDTAIEVWWPHLEANLNKLLEQLSTQEKSEKKQVVDLKQSGGSEILEEILELTRDQQKILSSPEKLLPVSYFRYVLRRTDININRIDKEAVRDLQINLMRARKSLGRDGDEMVPIENMRVLFERISDPAEYIIRKLSMPFNSIARDEIASSVDDNYIL